MTEATYVQPDGSRTTVDIAEGQSLMRAAILNGVPGIVGECGGQAMCATCHVYVDGCQDDLPPVSDDEAEMLEAAAAARTPASRLSCQLVGLRRDVTVDVPDTQY
ncbi:2Fe-2S iron-sulfur cluster-binding protein [Microbacterium sp. NPDC058062]|uniref:2Fe-2S iron-sulfur cluster-binding protein n=1 Tax=Microbacterium sp. NPDC058062 TaxID=3346320 RepID=UPI0036DF7D05